MALHDGARCGCKGICVATAEPVLNNPLIQVCRKLNILGETPALDMIFLNLLHVGSHGGVCDSSIIRHKAVYMCVLY